MRTTTSEPAAPFSLRLDAELRARLRREARREDLTVGQLIRRLLRKYLPTRSTRQVTSIK